MNGKGEELRDKVLSTALVDLEVPEHAPGFETRLQTLLEQEASLRHPEPAEAPPVRLRRRWRWPRLRPEWLPAAAALLVAVVVVVVTIAEPVTGPRVASAAEVRAVVAEAFENARSVRGTLVVSSEEEPRFERWSFVTTARGDLRLTRLGRPGDIAYDAGENVERSLNTSASMRGSDVLFGAEITGLAPGPPDHASSSTALERGLGSVVRALASSRGGEVEEIRYRDRTAWLLETELGVPDFARDYKLWPDHLEVTVDRSSGLPVRALASRDGNVITETRVEDLEVGGDVPQGTFTLRFPPGVEVFHSDEGFRRVALDQVGPAVGYEPLVPRFIPQGYELAEVAVAKRAGATGAFESNPATIDGVSLSYRRGLDQFVVTTRLIGKDPAAWDDPFDTGEGPVQDERVSFSSGVLAGHGGELVIDPLAPPHVWALTEDLVVTVSGDLTRGELMEVAGSLEPR